MSKRLRDERRRHSALAGAGNRHALERGMLLHVVGRFAVGDLPFDLALVEIDGADPAVRRLAEGKAANVERSTRLGFCGGRCGSRAGGDRSTAAGR